MKDTISLVIIGIIFIFGHFLINMVGADDNVVVYDKNWNVKERIAPNGTVYGPNWETKGFVRDNKIYDKNWNVIGNIKRHDIGKSKSSGGKK